MSQRLWLGFQWDAHAPCGPRRLLKQVSNPPPHLSARVDEHGVLRDGDPFCLFWEDAGTVYHRLLTPADTSLTVCGRAFTLVWREAAGGAGRLLLLYGVLNVPDMHDCPTEVTIESTGEFPALPAAHAYSFGWNSQGWGIGGKLAWHIGQTFGLPDEITHGPPPMKPEEAAA